jgi:hypothetical protein
MTRSQRSRETVAPEMSIAAISFAARATSLVAFGIALLVQLTSAQAQNAEAELLFREGD